jgi:hypothetical protein
MIFCDVARIVIFGLIPLWWLAGPQVWLLYVVVVLAAVFDMIFAVACVAAVANLVDGDQLVQANSRLQATNAIAYIVGPAVAGILAATVATTAAVGADALTFAVSAAGLSVIRFRKQDRDSRAGGPVGISSIRHGLLAGIRFILAATGAAK